MRLGVGIDGEARQLSARRQFGPVPAVQPLFHLDSPSQAKDDSASRDNGPGSRRSAASARSRGGQSHDPNIRGESNEANKGYPQEPVPYPKPDTPSLVALEKGPARHTWLMTVSAPSGKYNIFNRYGVSVGTTTGG